MLRRQLLRVQSAVLGHPRRVLAASFVAFVASLALGSGVEFRTARSELAPPDDPDQRRFDEMTREFGGFSSLIACVEAGPDAAPDAGRLRAFADSLAAEFRRDPLVAQVFYKVDLDWILKRGLHLVPPAALRAAAGAGPGWAALGALHDMRDLGDLNDAAAALIEAGLARPAPGTADAAGPATGHLAALLRAQRRFLEDPGGATARLASVPPLLGLALSRGEAASRGYLSSRDGSLLFLLVEPRNKDDSLPSLRAFVAALRARAASVSASHPGFRVAFTGEPATTVEEMDTVRRDTWTTSIVAVLGVALLTFMVFRWKTHALLLLAALAIGVTLSFGAVRLELGYLNLITSSFISTLVGVGIAYGIHLVTEYELQGAHTTAPLEAIRNAYHLTGAAITVSAVTTAAAFLAITLMEFRGFAELGLVAGVGVLLCLLAAFVTLPAMLVVYGRRRHARDRSERSGPPTAVVDRLWDEWGAGLVCRFPRTASVAALALTAACAWSARGLSFDTNILDLLPRDAESLRYQRRMLLESDLSPAFNIVVADDLPALRALRERAEAEPSIAKFESALQFIPEDPGASRAALRELAARLETLRLPGTPRPARREKLAASLQRLERALERASEAAFGAGLAHLAGPLEEARQEAGNALAVVRKAPAGAGRAWSAGQERLLAWARAALEDLKAAAAAEPATLESLPPGIRQRFLTRGGRLLGFIHPAGNIFDPQFLDEYVAASRRVSPFATGFPVVFHTMSRRITDGFYRALAVGAALVFVILLIDYRSLRDTLLASVPLAFGMVWMAGGMRLLGLSFNFANLVAVPLVIGVGIDNGVHMVHRIRSEGHEGMTVVLRHTGRAILIAGFTTMIGFGSLALASHRGLASLGIVLLLGVGACVVSATLVLPNLLSALRWVRR